jgi:hypothetical protein
MPGPPPPKLPICRPDALDENVESVLLKTLHVAHAALLEDLLWLIGNDALTAGHTFTSYREMLHEHLLEARRQSDQCDEGPSCHLRKLLSRLDLERPRLARYKVRLKPRRG